MKEKWPFVISMAVGAALLCGVKRGEQQVILHCMKESVWKERREKAFWGQRDLEKYGFLHCSSIAHFSFKSTCSRSSRALSSIDRNREKKKSRVECLCPVCGVTHCQNCGKECPDAGRN